MSNNSYDEILERMRNRVSAVAERDNVKKFLEDDQSEIKDNTLSQSEQDHAFLEMSKEQSPDALADQAATPTQPENNEANVDAAVSEQLQAEGTFVQEDPMDAENYEKILAALQMKDLASIDNENPSELEKIVAARSESNPETPVAPLVDQAVQTAEQPTAPVMNAEQEVAPQPLTAEQPMPVATEPQQAAMTAPAPNMQAVDKNADNVPAAVTAPTHSNQAIDRLATIANSLEKTLDVKKDVEATAPQNAETPAPQSNIAEQAQNTQPAPHTDHNGMNAPIDQKAPVQKASDTPVQAVDQAALPAAELPAEPTVAAHKTTASEAKHVETETASHPINADHIKRLDKLEASLKNLSETQENSALRAEELAKEQQKSLRIITREAQKVAEATALKHNTGSSSEETIELVKKYAASKEDLKTVAADIKSVNDDIIDLHKTVNTDIKGLHSFISKNSEKQDDSYLKMQESLAMLHEKMTSFQAETMQAVQTATQPQPAAEPQHIAKTVSEAVNNEFQQKQPAMPASKEPSVYRDSRLPVSAQVLKGFAHTPLERNGVEAPEPKARVNEAPAVQRSQGMADPLLNQVNANVQDPVGSEATAPHLNTSAPLATPERQAAAAVEEKKSDSKAPILLAISSMLMFSVSGYLFYNHNQEQQKSINTASLSSPASQSVAQNVPGVVGEKKLVKWSYNGTTKQNTERLTQSDKSLNSTHQAAISQVSSNTEILQIPGKDIGSPTVTGSIANNSAFNSAATNTSAEKNKTSNFKRPPVKIGSSLLRQSAARGIPSAMFEVARRFQNGKGVKKNYKKAVIWYRRASNAKYAPAQYRLGTLYERGRGVKKDIAQARDWYRKAAKLGNVKAMHNLGVIFSGQKKVRPDYAMAIKWFTRAANYGLADSQFNLAIINYNGLGKKKDMIQAYKWFALAAKNGDKAAKEQQQNLSQEMKISQIMNGRKQINYWKKLERPVQANINLEKKYSWQDYAEL